MADFLRKVPIRVATAKDCLPKSTFGKYVTNNRMEAQEVVVNFVKHILNFGNPLTSQDVLMKYKRSWLECHL